LSKILLEGSNLVYEVTIHPLVLLNIGINFIEFIIDVMAFGFFYQNFSRTRSKKRIQGHLSIGFGIAMLFLGIGRVFFIIFDYITPNAIIRVFAWIFAGTGMFAFMYVFDRVFEVFIPKLKRYMQIAVPCAVIIVVICFVFIFLIPGEVTFMVILCLILPSIILFLPQIYGFARTMIRATREIKKHMIIIMLGLTGGVIGYALTSVHQYLAPELSLLVKFICQSIYVAGITLFAIGFWGLPYSLRELDWQDKTHHLYLFTLEKALIIHEHKFKDLGEIEANLVSGGLTGLSILIQEITKKETNLRIIEQEGITIILEHGKFLTGAMIVEENLNMIRKKLRKFIDKVEVNFHQKLADSPNIISEFSEIEKITLKIFGEQ